MKNTNRGFIIKIVILVVGGLVLLKYAYDIDVISRVYELIMKLWGKYGNLVMRASDFIKTLI